MLLECFVQTQTQAKGERYHFRVADTAAKGRWMHAIRQNVDAAARAKGLKPHARGDRNVRKKKKHATATPRPSSRAAHQQQPTRQRRFEA